MIGGGQPTRDQAGAMASSAENARRDMEAVGNSVQPAPQPTLCQVEERIATIEEEIQTIGARLETLADGLCGSYPTVDKPAPCEVPHEGKVPRLVESLDRISRRLCFLRGQVSRLEEIG